MAKRKYKINFFDIAAVIALAIVALTVAFSYTNRPSLGSRSVLVEIKISDATMIEAAIPKLKTSGEVYFSGTKYPVRLDSYQTKGGSSDLYLTIVGPGDIYEGNSIFNGQRITTHQKVELRADYQVQGFVTDFRYEN